MADYLVKIADERGHVTEQTEKGFSEDEVRRQLDTAIQWGRYGELFDFDAQTGQLTLEPPSISRESEKVRS